MKVFLLFFCCVVFAIAKTTQKKVIFAIDVSGTRESLYTAYLKFIRTFSLQVSMYSFAAETVKEMGWTDSQSLTRIKRAIDDLEFIQGQCSNWTSVLETLFDVDFDQLILLTKASPAGSSLLEQSAQALKRQGKTIFAIGVGNFVTETDLKRVCGPCSPIVGCLYGVNYVHAHTYNHHKRSAHISLAGSACSST